MKNHRKRVSETLKRDYSEGRIKPSRGFLGKHHSEESKLKISLAHLGKRHSEETKQKMSLAKKDKPKTEEHSQNISRGKKGIRTSPTTEFKKGHKPSQATKQKISESSKGRIPWNKGKSNPNWIGEKNPRWNGGNSLPRPYPPAFNKDLKKQIKDRDGHQCQFPDCGLSDDLVVHHIDYDKENNDPMNLITVCRSHNTKMSYDSEGLENWTKFFQELLS